VNFKSFKETRQMRQSELHHRQSYSSSTSQLNDKTEKRIVTLYTSGQSVDSIAREVGRARHRVVHLLQTKGVFGNGQTRRKEPEGESIPVDDPTEDLSAAGSEPEIAVQKPATSRRRAKAPRKASVSLTDVPSAIEKTDRWSPPVVDALCKVAVQSNLYPGKSVDEVREIVVESNMLGRL
jgi:hypothetical protein